MKRDLALGLARIVCPSQSFLRVQTVVLRVVSGVNLVGHDAFRERRVLRGQEWGNSRVKRYAKKESL